MPGPFPGMDPYLENHWGDVHLKLLGFISEQLNERLPPDLVCRGEEFVRMGDPDGGSGTRVRPDDYVVEPADLPGALGWSSGGPGAAVLEQTDTYTMEIEPVVERWLEIRTADGDRLVTSIEVLSGGNKTGTRRDDFRAKQRGLIAAGVSLMEIDLVRAGRWSLYPDEAGVPERYREPYRLAATAAQGGWPRSTFTRVALREPLPPTGVPLRRGEPPAVLELQSLVDRVWRAGRYGTHYRRDPPPFPPNDAAWIAERVRAWRESLGGGEAEPTAPPAAG